MARRKGNTDCHLPNQKMRSEWTKMLWDSPQFCEECWSKPCRCADGKEEQNNREADTER